MGAITSSAVKLFDRYICRTVLLATGAVFLAFAGLLSVFAIIEEANDQRAAYALGEALLYVALTLPRRSYELLPYAAFLGGLVGLGHLASRWELATLRAAGVSALRLFAGLSWAIAGISLVGALVGEWIAPGAEAAAEARKARLVRGGDAIAIAGWYREGSLYTQVDALSGDGDLVGVRQYWLDDAGALIRVREAVDGSYVSGAAPHWVLHDVTETRIGNESTTAERLPKVVWQGEIDPRLLGERVLVDPRRLSIGDLYHRIGYMQREGLDAAPYRLAFWSKCLQPASVFGLVLLALAFVLGPLREAGIGVRISAGIIVGLCFKYLQDLFAPMSQVYGLQPPVAVLLPIVLCWLVALWGVRRVA